ncbi:hypothetical protein, partial [Hydrogenophaga sp.]|uniref:hypothetical protein n=1 Tax=Hydrogenophaga sp. TaxID=1904254 RepID=UPI00286E5550
LVNVVLTPLTTTTGVKVTVALPLLDRVTVVVTVLPTAPEGIGWTFTPGSLSRPVPVSVSLLFVLLLSGTLGAVTLAVTVAPVAVSGTVIGALLVLWPGASVTLVNVVLTPLTTTTGVKVTVVLPLLLRVTVVVTVLPAAPEGMGWTFTPGSLSRPVPVSVSLLFVLLLSGTLGAVTLAVTVAPVAVSGTVIGALLVLWPGASVTLVNVVLTPLTTTTGVKVTVVLPLLLKVTVVVTVLPTAPAGMGWTFTPGSLNRPAPPSVSLLLAVLLSGTLGLVTLAVTVAPVAVSGTVIGALLIVWPGASVTLVNVVLTPLTTTTGVKVTVVLPLLLKVTVVVTVLPTAPEGMGWTFTPGSLNRPTVVS